MPARPYQPSGKTAQGALLQLLLATNVLAIVTGVAEGFVGRWWLRLLILFPILIGLAAGGAATFVIRGAKIRAPVMAAAVACLAAMLGQVATHVTDYVLWRRDVATEVRQRLAEALNDPELTPEDRAQMQAVNPEQQIDTFLQEEHGHGGFLGYLQLAAKSGVTISRASSSRQENNPTVTGVGTYVLWGLELLFAAGIAVSMAYSRAKQPFCEHCDDWFGRVDLLGAGSGGKENVAEVIRALEAGDLERALSAEALGQPSDGATSILRLERCANCAEHEPLLTFKVVKQRGRNKAQESEKYKTLLRPDEAHTLDTLLAKRTAEEQAQAAVAAAQSA